MQRGHSGYLLISHCSVFLVYTDVIALTILVAEFVGGPYTALASLGVHGIHESEALGLCGILAFVGRITQQAGRHARPEGEDDEG